MTADLMWITLFAFCGLMLVLIPVVRKYTATPFQRGMEANTARIGKANSVCTSYLRLRPSPESGLRELHLLPASKEEISWALMVMLDYYAQRGEGGRVVSLKRAYEGLSQFQAGAADNSAASAERIRRHSEIEEFAGKATSVTMYKV
ncbi:MAG: hypothetical protein V3573_08335 [Desulfovibrionaceae bacterium]